MTTEITADGLYVVQNGELVAADSFGRIIGGAFEAATIGDLKVMSSGVVGGGGGGGGARTLLIGSQYNNNGDLDVKQMEAAMGLDYDAGQRLDMHRCYETGPPPGSWANTKAAPDIAEDRGFWLSFKGAIQSWLAGSYDTNMKKLCNTIDPTWPRVFLSVWHEPEPKFKDGTLTPEEWVDLQIYFYELCKPLVPANTRIAPIHGGYAWRPGDAATSDPSRWMVPQDHRDFVGFDCYGHTTTGNLSDRFSKDPISIFDRFQQEIVLGDDLCLAETGTRLRDAAGNDWITNGLIEDMANHDNVIGMSYWNSTSTVDPGLMPPDMMLTYGNGWRKYSPQSVGVIS